MPVLGVLTDPEAPEKIAHRLADRLPDLIPDRLGDERDWSVQVVRDPVAAGRGSGEEILKATDEQRTQQGWDYAVCITDLPLRFDHRPVLADIGIDNGIGLISLPALGGLQPYRRATQMMLQILDEILAATSESREQPRQQRRRGLHSRLTELLAPIRRENPDREEIGVRYRASRKSGRVRLLSGMVRSNSPWRVMLGMSGAMAAALATSAFGLSSNTIWQIGHRLSGTHQLTAMLASIVVLVAWLIAAHRLWERPRHSIDPEQRWLYNTSTVTTLTIGITTFYLGLWVLNLAIAWFLVPFGLLSSTLQPPVTGTAYISLAWGFTTMGMIAGGLGSSLESDQTVRRAAYGYREAQRRRTTQQHQDDH